MGYDGELLNDYLWLKERIDNPILKRLFHSVAGYFVALGLKTIPRHVRGRGISTTMRITALEPAWYMDPLNGDEPVEHPAGAVLFEGAASVASVGSVPFYGYGVRIFPFAGQKPGTFQLRVASVSVFHAVANIGALWRGAIETPKGVTSSTAGSASRAMRRYLIRWAVTAPGGAQRLSLRWMISRFRWSICAPR